jgi:hypothetical protein
MSDVQQVDGAGGGGDVPPAADDQVTIGQRWAEFRGRVVKPGRREGPPALGFTSELYRSILRLRERVVSSSPTVKNITDEIGASTNSEWTTFLQSQLTIRNSMLSALGEILRLVLSGYGEIIRNIGGR